MAGDGRMIVRAETPADAPAIRRLNVVAFQNHPYSRHTEHLIVEALRDAGALELSLVAELDGVVVGHVAFSKTSVGDMAGEWYILGPIAVDPAHQGRGVGDPAFYNRFGFRAQPGLTHAGVPDENVLGLAFGGRKPTGEISCHAAFRVEA